MKKQLLLLIAFAVGVLGSKAQTDVTSTYLTNPGFDACYAESSDVSAKTIRDYSSNGWTNASTGSFTTIAVTAYGSGKKVGDSTTPSTKQDGTVSGNTLGIIAGWGDEVKIQSDDITLPPGNYTLTVDHYLTSSTTNYGSSSSRFGFVTSGTSYIVSSTAFTASTWTTETVSFTLTESTTGKIQIGLKGENKSGSGSPAVFYDDVTLTYTDFKAELRTVLAQAQAINSRLNTLDDDITTAQTVLNTVSSPKTEIDGAVSTLRTAIRTKLAAYDELDPSGDNISSFIANNGFETSSTFDGTSLGSNSDPKSNAVPTAGSTLLLNAKNVYQVNGWELLTTETSDFARTFTMPYDMTLYVVSNGSVAGQAVASPTNASSETTNNDNLLFVEANWCQNAVLGVKQTVPLLKGSYRLTFDTYVTTTVSNAESLCGVSYGEVSNYKWPAATNTWTSNEVDFTLDEQKDVTISMGYKKLNNVGGGSSAFLFIDNVKLIYFDPLKLAQLQWQEVYDALDALDDTALPDAAKNAISTELAKAMPSTVEECETAKAALQALIDSYEGIKVAYAEYKALKAAVEDLKNTSKYTFTGDAALSAFNSTLSTIDGNAEAATDAATLTALLPSLKTAGNTFVGAIESNDGFDLSYNIENNSFETGALSPWTTNGSNDTGVKPNSNGTYTTTGVDGSYLFNTWNNGAGSKVSQTLSSLPEGYYTVTALVASDAGNTINILAGASTKSIAADATVGKTKFVEGTTDKVLVSDGSLEIGTNSSTWYKSDYFRLTYYTVTAGAAEAWAAAKAAAEAARDDVAYTNVTGSEKTELLAEIDKAEPSTAEAYGTATTALQEKTSTFTAAKDSYDALVAMRTTGNTYTTAAWPRASGAKATALANAIAAAPTDAADAVTKTNAIVTAYRQFVESNGLAEGVDVAFDYTSTYLAGADPDTNTGWTNGIGTDLRSQEIYTKGDGTQGGRYYDGGWSTSAAVNINMTRELTLPAGQYQLQITARGSANLTSYTMSIGEETVDLPKEGADAAVGTFGHGWSDRFVVFNSDGTTPLTLAIVATSTEYQQWISFNRLRLVKLDATLATAQDYADLNGAIDAAEANLGFEAGQNAPYNNTEAMALLLAAKAIDQTVNNVQGDVQDATTALTNATWTQNTSDVDAIYNGSFATVAEGQNYPDGWTRTNAWGQQQTGLTGDYATAYYNQPGSLQYGNQGVYTMPLAANTAYKLTFAYRSHENNSNRGVKASILKGEDGLVETDFPANGSTSEWKVVSKHFTTSAAGDYVLTLANSGNTWMTGVSLVKFTPTVISETDDQAPATAEKADVTLTRTLKGGQWNSFSVPFGFTVTGSALDGAEVKQFASANGNEITLEDATAIVAGDPYLVKPASDIVNPVFYNVTVDNPDEAVKGTGDYTFQAHLYNTFLAKDGSVAYVSTTDSSIKKLTSGGLKGLRAYFNIPTGSNVKPLNVNFGDGFATGILTVDTDGNIYEGTIYNLSGQRVNTMQKGIYIVNGKKIIVK